MSSQDSQDKPSNHNPMTSVQHDRSGSNPTLFSSMTQAKRHSDNDKAEATRKSLADQSAPKGVLGNMWDGMMKSQQSK